MIDDEALVMEQDWRIQHNSKRGKIVKWSYQKPFFQIQTSQARIKDFIEWGIFFITFCLISTLPNGMFLGKTLPQRYNNKELF